MKCFQACTHCGEMQFSTYHGNVCINGHGGVEWRIGECSDEEYKLKKTAIQEYLKKIKYERTRAYKSNLEALGDED